MKIAVYGSLRKGFYNHKRFGLGDPIAESKVRGAMYLLFTYPHLYREEACGEDEKVTEHKVEIYEVEDKTYQMIRAMELGAGYDEHKITLEGHDVSIFFSRDDLDYKKNWIESYEHAN